jgi:integrase
VGDVNFYLKKAEKTTGRSLIYLQYKYKGLKLTYTFGETIDPNNWNKKKQRVKSNTETTADGQHSLNDLLDNLVKVTQKAYNSEIKNGTPLPGTLKKYLDDFIDQNKNEDRKKAGNPTLYNLIDRFISGEIKKKGNVEKSTNTLDNYAATKKHLQAFEKEYGYKIDFDTITLDFFYTYTNFLKKGYPDINRKGEKIRVKLSTNTIAKDIVFLKVFMNKAVKLGYTSNIEFKNDEFFVKEQDTDAVYLKENEIEHLFRFTAKNRKLEDVKDKFVFGSLSGLRYSDYNNVGEEHIIEEAGEPFIKIKTQKTGEIVFIPCHPIVLEIFEKYKDNPSRLPKRISNQKFNEYIKLVCQDAGLTETGRLSTGPSKPLYECITSHTARRSFCTNLYLQGFPVIEIMKISGHTTERSFMKYIKVSKLDTAKRLSTHMKKMWENKLHKIENTALKAV